MILYNIFKGLHNFTTFDSILQNFTVFDNSVRACTRGWAEGTVLKQYCLMQKYRDKRQGERL